MNNADVVELPVSRPKIHRLPASLSSQKRRHLNLLSIVPHLIRHAHRGARMTVLLVVVSAALFILARVLSPSVDIVEADLEPTAGDAMAAIPAPQNLSLRSSKTIHIKDNSEVIVGQLARIPSENGSIADIKTVSDVDNRAGRELLSIISKY